MMQLARKQAKKSIVRLVSMVRAGEHALASMIEAALSPEFEFVDKPLAGSLPYRLFRTNDTASDHPVRMPNTKLIVLTREPRGQMLAMAARMRKLYGARFPENNVDHIEFWLAQTALGRQRFMNKWVNGAMPTGTVTLDYSLVSGEPDVALCQALGAYGITLSQDQAHVYAKLQTQPEKTSSPIAEDIISDYVAAVENPGGAGRIARIARLLDRVSEKSPRTGEARAEAEELANPGLLKAFG